MRKPVSTSRTRSRSGVGKLTDMAIIRDGKVTFGSPSLLEILEKAHKEKPALSSDEHKSLKKACDGLS